ncbi:hypothetical protein C9374_009044 [Naegleria lovaniensis]|uniref:Protein kinase domain-containing protein n=1 Tax=Naegleria lovaniensis TaxID=51637 RepID=A0AA88GK03_NAELO|nr:uncharacterized protein C9374_009044 [Naegleria lovaniensis]KAG2377528.1 hypothetical protein C9374_009044 [Naegleria lovaniensis]
MPLALSLNSSCTCFTVTDESTIFDFQPLSTLSTTTTTPISAHTTSSTTVSSSNPSSSSGASSPLLLASSSSSDILNYYDILQVLPSISSSRTLFKEIQHVANSVGELACFPYVQKQQQMVMQSISAASGGSSEMSPTTPHSSTPTSLFTSLFNSTSESSSFSNSEMISGKTGQQFMSAVYKKYRVETNAMLVKDRVSNELLVMKPILFLNEEDFERKSKMFEKLKAIALTSYNVVTPHRFFRYLNSPMSTDEDFSLLIPQALNSSSGSEYLSPSAFLSQQRKKRVGSLAFMTTEYVKNGDLFQLLWKYKNCGKKFSVMDIFNFIIQVCSTLSCMKVKQTLSSMPKDAAVRSNERISVASSSDIEGYVDEILSVHGKLTGHNILVDFEPTGLYKFCLHNFSFMRNTLLNKQKHALPIIDDNKENDQLLLGSQNELLLFPSPPELMDNPEENYLRDYDDCWCLGVLMYQLVTGKPICFDEQEQREILKAKAVRTLNMSIVNDELENYLKEGLFAVEHESTSSTPTPLSKKRKKQLEEELYADAKVLVDLTLGLLSYLPEERLTPLQILQHETTMKYMKMIHSVQEEKGTEFCEQVGHDISTIETQKQNSQNSALYPFLSQKDYISLQFFHAYHKEKGIEEKWDTSFFRQERIGQEDNIIQLLELSFNNSIRTFIFAFIRNLHLNVLQDFRREVNLPTDYKMLKIIFLNMLSLQAKKKSNIAFKHVRSFIGQALPLIPEMLLLIVLLESIELLLENDYEYYSTHMFEYNKVQLFNQIQKIETEITSLISKHEIDSSQFRIATRLSKKETEVRYFIERYTLPLAQKLVDGLKKADPQTSGSKGNIVLSLLRYIVCNCFQKEHKWVLVGNEGKMEGKLFGFEDIFSNKKKRSRCSLNFTYTRDYVNAEGNIQLQLAFSKHGDKEVLFADRLEKVNDKCKIQKRIFVVSDLAVYNIDPSNFKIKRRVEISEIESIYVSTYTDGYFVLKVPNSYDFLYSAWRRTELIMAIQKVSNIPVHVSNRFPFNPAKGDNRQVVFVEDSKTPKSNVKLVKKEYIVTVRPPETDPINIESVHALVTMGKSSEQREIVLDPYDVTTLKLPPTASYKIRFKFYVNTNLNCFLDEFIKADNETVFQLVLGQFEKSEDPIVLMTDKRTVCDYFALKTKKTQVTMKIMDTERQAIHSQQFQIEYDMQ